MAEPQQAKQLTSLNADDCFLDARARIEQWQQEFQSAWFKPQIDTMAKLTWMTQPDEIKNYVRQNKPKAAKKMDDLMAGKEG